MTSDKLDLDPIQALTLEAFSEALAQLDSASVLPAELREEQDLRNCHMRSQPAKQ